MDPFAMNVVDQPLAKRIADMSEELCEETGVRRRDLERHRGLLEAELATRRLDRQHGVFAGYFSALLRYDLVFSRRDGDEWADVGDGEVVMVDDTRTEATDLVQCTRDNYDYCTEDGASWQWVPLAFGPIRESSR